MGPGNFGLSFYSLPEDGIKRAVKIGKLLREDNFVFTDWEVWQPVDFI